MTGWTPTPPTGGRQDVGWSVDPPAPSPPAGQTAWRPLINELAAALSVSRAEAAVALRDTAAALSVSHAEAAVALRLAAPAASSSVWDATAVGKVPTIAPAASSSVWAAVAAVRAAAAAQGVSASTGLVSGLRSSAAASSRSGDATVVRFPVTAPLEQQFTTVGAWAYTIPYWCRAVDVVLLSGGRGGGNGGFVTGEGGRAGVFAAITLVRGVDVAWTHTAISGALGAGGASNAGAGGNTTATLDGINYMVAAGGNAGSGLGWPGSSAGTFVWNGISYVGGAAGAQGGGAGGDPGGGGGGGNFFGAGGVGGKGRVWIRAYQ
ncbi:minor tail protein [Mycobacterium phage Yuna]|uniref:Glycine-rich domain-containing protein n=1 Tax=Mycobacterium phage Yuna TaxID=2599885 RepID=A0A5J6TEW8_9CAUD|nr:minor tail protein [Mycobacterium phage Yuna]QFG09411.1 hypothetical protein PBI_YUNA_29 [Mycobacterium phage Yuna]